MVGRQTQPKVGRLKGGVRAEGHSTAVDLLCQRSPSARANQNSIGSIRIQIHPILIFPVNEIHSGFNGASLEGHVEMNKTVRSNSWISDHNWQW